jgi:predicted nucleotidyltransferase
MPTSVEDAASHLLRQTELRRVRAAARAARLRTELPRARRLLRDYGADRILLFGSLQSGTFSEHSDVDLAVESLPSEAYFPALADLLAIFAVPVDLVRLEEASSELRERILTQGVDL